MHGRANFEVSLLADLFQISPDSDLDDNLYPSYPARNTGVVLR